METIDAITSALVLALSSLLFVAEASARAEVAAPAAAWLAHLLGAHRQSGFTQPATAPAPGARAHMQPAALGLGRHARRAPRPALIGAAVPEPRPGCRGIGLTPSRAEQRGLIGCAIVWMRRGQAAGAGGTPAYAGGYSGSGSSSGGWQPSGGSTYSGGGSSAAPAAMLDAPSELSDLDRGVGHIRQMDAQFDPAAFSESATDIFFKIQAAWTNRDMGRVTDLLTPEMRGVLQAQCDKLRADRRINRLENIAVRQAAVTEGWQEKGQDFVTVYFLASLVDYTTDESGAQVLDGSRTEPVKFEEYWTFTRPVGPNPWKLSAIQQPA